MSVRMLTDAELDQLEFNARMLASPGVPLTEAVFAVYLEEVVPTLIANVRAARGAAGDR